MIVRSSSFHWKIYHVQSELSKLIEQSKITNHQTTEKREIEACDQLQTSLFATSQLQCIIYIFTNWFIHISSRAPPNKKIQTRIVVTKRCIPLYALRRGRPKPNPYSTNPGLSIITSSTVPPCTNYTKPKTRFNLRNIWTIVRVNCTS